MNEQERIDLFLEALAEDEELRASAAAIEDLGERLEALEREGAEAWPELELAPGEFAWSVALRLRQRPPKGGDLSGWLEDLRAADLHLATACAAGQSEALLAFEHAHRHALGKLLRRYRGPKMPEEDLRQHLYEKLFVDTEDRPAKIHSYSGHGSLDSWLQVTGARLFIDRLRHTSRRHKETPTFEEGQMLQMPDPEEDPELQFLKREYRAEFKRAFEASARALTSQQRNLLRQSLIAGLSIDQLGKLYQCHRATAARRVARARDALIEGTRRELMSNLSINQDEFESIMELIRSRLDLSMPRMLRTVTESSSKSS